MNDQSESPADGHNFNKALSNDISTGAKTIDSLKAQRQALNAQINEIRLEMEGKGIPRQALDLALRISGWDEEKMQAFDYAYIFCRAAIEQPVEPDLFTATSLEEISTRDKLEEALAKIGDLEKALANATLSTNRLMGMMTTARDIEAPEFLEYADAGARYARQIEEKNKALQAGIEGREYEPPQPEEKSASEAAQDAAEQESEVEHDEAAAEVGSEETADEQQAREIAHIQGAEDRPAEEHWDSEDDQAEQEQWDAADPSRQGNAVIEDDFDTAAEDEHDRT